jgi:hypothetical protein
VRRDVSAHFDRVHVRALDLDLDLEGSSDSGTAFGGSDAADAASSSSSSSSSSSANGLGSSLLSSSAARPPPQRAPRFDAEVARVRAVAAADPASRSRQVLNRPVCVGGRVSRPLEIIVVKS